MDERRTAYSLIAPGSPGSGASLRLPDRGFPRVDDHLVEPEVTRDEIIGGRRVVASPAQPSYATLHSRLNYVLCAHVAHGYLAASDLCTRFDEESDFAIDTCLFRDGVDPATDARYLEEIAFAIVWERNEAVVEEKILRMCRRGVRRIFSIVVKDRQVREWLPDMQSWRSLDSDSRIEDRCFLEPLPVSALLDPAAADDAVAGTLIAKENKRRAVKAKAEDILAVLEARGLAVSEPQRQEILRCQDLDRLGRWLRRAALAATAGEVTSDT